MTAHGHAFRALAAATRIDDIQRVTCQFYGMDPAWMTDPGRARARPRQVAMLLAREMTGASYPIIGRHFGGRDHTTVLHACRRVAALMREDESLRVEVNAIRFSLRVAGADRAALAAAVVCIGVFIGALGDTLYPRPARAAA